MPRSRSALVRLAFTGTLALAGAACMTWKNQPAPPGQFIQERSPDRVRLTRADGSMIELVQPFISGDTLIGRWADSKDTASRVFIPVSDVKSVAVRRVHAAKTGLLIAGVGLTAIAVIGAATADDPYFAPQPPSSGGDYGWGVSCPLVYSWDGTHWRLDSGTFGGAIAPALARTDLDNLVYAVPERGLLRLRVANELNETDYLDALSVVVVDHPAGHTIAPDGQGHIHTLGRLTAPSSARDFRGGDALARVSKTDGWGWESNPSGRDTAVTQDIRDGLEVVFPRPLSGNARLVLDGSNTPWAAYLIQRFVEAHGSETQAWYDSLETSPAIARGLGSMLAKEAFLGVSVWANGRWQRQGYIWEAGPEIVKRQVFSLDLSRVEGDSVRIRLESAPSFWSIDHVALDSTAPARFEAYEVQAQHAVDGAGTDVSDQLRSSDHRYLVLEHGDGAEMLFRVPPPAAGRSRSYLVRSSGWYRIHTPATGAPDTRMLSRVLTESHGASRLAVAEFNQALLSLRRAHQ
jgi:hypothetical protein